jgi:hypothetical protein
LFGTAKRSAEGVTEEEGQASGSHNDRRQVNGCVEKIDEVVHGSVPAFREDDAIGCVKVR